MRHSCVGGWMWRANCWSQCLLCAILRHVFVPNGGAPLIRAKLEIAMSDAFTRSGRYFRRTKGERFLEKDPLEIRIEFGTTMQISNAIYMTRAIFEVLLYHFLENATGSLLLSLRNMTFQSNFAIRRRCRSPLDGGRGGGSNTIFITSATNCHAKYIDTWIDDSRRKDQMFIVEWFWFITHCAMGSYAFAIINAICQRTLLFSS